MTIPGGRIEEITTPTPDESTQNPEIRLTRKNKRNRLSALFSAGLALTAVGQEECPSNVILEVETQPLTDTKAIPREIQIMASINVYNQSDPEELAILEELSFDDASADHDEGLDGCYLSDENGTQISDAIAPDTDGSLTLQINTGADASYIFGDGEHSTLNLDCDIAPGITNGGWCYAPTNLVASDEHDHQNVNITYYTDKTCVKVVPPQSSCELEVDSLGLLWITVKPGDPDLVLKNLQFNAHGCDVNLKNMEFTLNDNSTIPYPGGLANCVLSDMYYSNMSDTRVPDTDGSLPFTILSTHQTIPDGDSIVFSLECAVLPNAQSETKFGYLPTTITATDSNDSPVAITETSYYAADEGEYVTVVK